MAPSVHRFTYHGPLTTVIDVRVEGTDQAMAEAVAGHVVAEVERLERVFNAYDPTSELCRWRQGEQEPGPELAEVLGHALAWQERSDGIFNPLVGELTALWREAERTGTEPPPGLLGDVVAAIRAPRVALVDGALRPVGDCSRFQLNAMAKGWIVDRAVDGAFARYEPAGLLVSAGGDLRHRGTAPAMIGIENPLRPYDNEPPLRRLRLAEAALATSGPSRRGFAVNGRRHSHILDPRSGRPVSAGVAGVSVVADDALTADVAATVASVLAPDEAIAWLDATDEVSGLVIDTDGGVRTDRSWPRRGTAEI